MKWVLCLAFAFVMTVSAAHAQTLPPWRGAGVAAWSTAQISVGNTATLVAAARPGRAQIMLTNPTANDVFCGPTNTVSPTTGDILKGGAASPISSVKVYDIQSAVWCIAATTSVISIAELF